MHQDYYPRFHHTLLQYFINQGHPEIASLLVDAELFVLEDDDGNEYGVLLDIPISSYTYIFQNPEFQQIILEAVNFVGIGYFFNNHGGYIKNISIQYRIKLEEIEAGWKDVIKDLIANAKNPNQGLVTEKAFAKESKDVLYYNEMKFASRTEIRIAQEFERRKILFFPLPLAVRNDTGNLYKDHREVDFLVCDKGVWGILEVSHHEGRYEKDSEKDTWFKLSGILCIQHYTAEKCYNDTTKVVAEFLGILAQHKK